MSKMEQQGDKWKIYSRAFVSAAIIDYIEFVGINDKITQKQVADMADLIVTEYGGLRLDDIVLFFRYCKLAKYGKLFGTNDLNPQTIFDWMRRYIHDKNEAMHKIYTTY